MNEQEDKVRDFAKAAKTTNDANDMEQVVNPIFETSLEEKEHCGNCKTEKVNGKCTVCGRPKTELADMEKEWNERFQKEYDRAMLTAGLKDSGTAQKKVDWKEVIWNEYGEGASDVEIRVMLDISQGLWDRFLEEEEAFLITIEKGRQLSENWWTRTGRVNLKEKDFSAQLFKINMQNRFNWREKQDTDMKSDGKAIQGLAVSFVRPDDSQS